MVLTESRLTWRDSTLRQFIMFRTMFLLRNVNANMDSKTHPSPTNVVWRDLADGELVIPGDRMIVDGREQSIIGPNAVTLVGRPYDQKQWRLIQRSVNVSSLTKHIQWTHQVLRDEGHCIDGGKCHHRCNKAGECFREKSCHPFSGSGLDETWQVAGATLLAPPPESATSRTEHSSRMTRQNQPLTVRLMCFPESNGDKNWTAMFVRKAPFDGLVGNAGGITIERGEFWNRVKYAAEEARFLLGERDNEPDILQYGTDVKDPDEWTGNDPDMSPIEKGTP